MITWTTRHQEWLPDRRATCAARFGLHAAWVGRIVAFSLLSSPSWLVAQHWPAERTAGPFAYHADFRLDAHAQLLSQVARLHDEIPRRLDLNAPKDRINVYLFSDKRVYDKYMKHYFPGVPYRRALFIKDRGPGMVFAYRSHELDVDLRHEATHAVLHSLLPMVPLWLDEGLAEYFEVEASERQMNRRHLRSVRWRTRLRQTPDLERLEQLSELADMKHDDYRDAWAWVHFMLHGPQPAQTELRLYLAEIQAHVPPGKLAGRLRRRLPNLKRDFLRHFAAMTD